MLRMADVVLKKVLISAALLSVGSTVAVMLYSHLYFGQTTRPGSVDEQSTDPNFAGNSQKTPGSYSCAPRPTQLGSGATSTSAKPYDLCFGSMRRAGSIKHVR